MDPEKNMTPKDDAFPSAVSSEKSNLSMFVGVGAFLIILVGLGWYVFQGGMSGSDILSQAQVMQQNTNEQSTTTATSTEDAAVVTLSSQGTSDTVTDINADLKATDLNSLGDIDKI